MAWRTIDTLVQRTEFAARAVARAALGPGATARRVVREAHRVVGAVCDDLRPRAPQSRLGRGPDGPLRVLDLEHPGPRTRLYVLGARPGRGIPSRSPRTRRG